MIFLCPIESKIASMKNNFTNKNEEGNKKEVVTKFEEKRSIFASINVYLYWFHTYKSLNY